MAKKSESVALVKPIPPPPAFRMIDKMVDLLPRIQMNQELLIRYFRNEMNDYEKMNDNLDRLSFKLPLPWPPMFPMMEDAINLLPIVVRQQKEIKNFISRRIKAATKLQNDFEKVGKAPKKNLRNPKV